MAAPKLDSTPPMPPPTLLAIGALGLALGACSSGESSPRGHAARDDEPVLNYRIGTMRLAARVYDNDADGLFDAIDRFVYDVAGVQIGFESDTDNDGTVDARVALAYAENGYERRRETDTDLDGEVDRSAETVFDDEGRAIAVLIDDDGNGVAETRVETLRDVQGRASGFRRDEGRDGTIETSGTYLYDDAGRRHRIELDTDGDGSLDFTRVFTFGPSGNVTSFDLIAAESGERVLFVRYDYEIGVCDPTQVTGSVGRECVIRR